MAALPPRHTRSIGEVLALLKHDFDDITISKIRFLEGQGLIEPERTASGYRKFSDGDIARLRYILQQQRDQFLPLKVIKERLDEAEAAAASAGSGGEGAPGAPLVPTTASVGALDRAGLLSTSGLSEPQLRELERYNMISANQANGGSWYGDEALAVARMAARFLSFGVEVRHLRTFKTGVDREADLYRQLTPEVRSHRNTQSRMDAEAKLQELTQLGEALRAELLRAALADS